VAGGSDAFIWIAEEREREKCPNVWMYEIV